MKRWIRWSAVFSCAVMALGGLVACSNAAAVDSGDADADLPTVTTSLTGATRALSAQWLGVNGNALMPWCDDGLLVPVGALSPDVFRYPGGTTANFWDWKSKTYWPSLKLPGVQLCSEYNLELIDKSLQAAGGNPALIYVLDLLSWNDAVLPPGLGALDSAARANAIELLDHGKALGLGPKLVELGNEFNVNNTEHRDRFPTGADYAVVAQAWMDNVHAAYPSAKVSIVGASRLDAGHNVAWNQSLFSAVRGALRFEQRSAIALDTLVTGQAGEVKIDTGMSTDLVTLAPYSVTRAWAN